MKKNRRGEQLEKLPYFSISPKIRRWIKNQHNRHIRRESKNKELEHPVTNKYNGWVW